jgi:hypothetical protein
MPGRRAACAARSQRAIDHGDLPREIGFGRFPGWGLPLHFQCPSAERLVRRAAHSRSPRLLRPVGGAPVSAPRLPTALYPTCRGPLPRNGVSDGTSDTALYARRRYAHPVNEATISPIESEDVRESLVRFRTRFLTYLGVWLLAALAFEVALQPEGLTETYLTPLQQRLQWPLYTPLMVFFGLSQALSTPRDVPQYLFWLFVAVFLFHALLVLRRVRLPVFAALIGLQALTLAVGVAYFVHFSRLPDGP